MNECLEILIISETVFEKIIEGHGIEHHDFSERPFNIYFKAFE